jgi:hypothetical protein
MGRNAVFGEGGPLASAALAAAVFMGGISLACVPVGAIWAISHFTADHRFSLLGAPVALIAWAAAVGRLNQTYVRVSGRRDASILETAVTIGVLLAIVVLVLIVFVFSGPNQSNAGPVPT